MPAHCSLTSVPNGLTTRALIDSGEEVVVLDNLITGHVDAVHEKAKLVLGDLRDEEFLDKVFTDNKIEGVIDFAAFSLVGESMTEPLKYFENNFYGTLCLLKAMRKHNVKNIVFSSTAATYGEPENIPILETDRTFPTNPYGESKLAVEKMMKWCDVAYGIKFTALRYFNVAGAHPTKDQTFDITDNKEEQLLDEKVKEYNNILSDKDSIFTIEQMEEAMQKVMDAYAGGISSHYQFNENCLNLAKEKINNLITLSGQLSAQDYHELMFYYELKERLTICLTLIEHLKARKETRWHSFAENLDHPQKSDDWKKYVNTKKVDGKIKVILRELVKEDEYYEHQN